MNQSRTRDEGFFPSEGKRNGLSLRSFGLALKDRALQWIEGGKDSYPDGDVAQKANMINALGLIGIFTLVPLGVLAHIQGEATVALFDFLTAALLGALIVDLKKRRNPAFASYLGISIAGILFVYLFASGGVKNTGHIWYYTFPLVAAFLLGSRKGAIATMIMLCLALLSFALEDIALTDFRYSKEFKLRFIPSFLVVFLYAYLFEHRRNRTQNELRLKNAELEERLAELKEARAAAEKASRAKTDFLAGMSHELRTPLNHIMGFTELLLDKAFGNLNNLQEEYLRDVLASSKHLLSLINDALDLSKVEAGKLELECSEVNLRILLERTLMMIKEKALKQRIRVSLEVDGIPQTIRADERKLKQILYNLLSNAAKFTPEGGEIRVQAAPVEEGSQRMGRSLGMTDGCMGTSSVKEPTEPSRFVQVWVADTGIGIGAEDLERIFDPFVQARNDGAPGTDSGTGLGLALCRRLVELHGGRIWAESEGKGRGSQFTFLLPLSGGCEGRE
jgi:signal transduction histidine kinase